MEVLIVFLVGWVLIGFICGMVASRKNRSFIGWFFLGILFGLIALLIIACLGPYRDQPAVVVVQAK